jgi:hypothetical protein
MRAQTAAKVELAKTLWLYGHDGSSGEEMLNERRRIAEMTAAFECILRNATAIFEEEGSEGGCYFGDATSVLEWI